MAKSRGSKRGRKKKRVAVHIKEALEKRATSGLDSQNKINGAANITTAGVGRPSKRPREPDGSKAEDTTRKRRERTEASAYLVAWLSARKAKRKPKKSTHSEEAGPAVWKFNKITQAWLLRHMFSEDQVGEDDFVTMCLYLEGLKGAARDRVLSEAQDMIDKHGPGEDREQTATARTTAAATASGTAGSTIGEPLAGTEGDAPKRAPGRGGKSVRFAVEAAGELCDGEGLDNRKGDKDEDTSNDDSADSDDEAGPDGSGDAPGDAGNGVEPERKKRKARSAVTGEAKAEAKARAATVAYERALQVAEVLA